MSCDNRYRILFVSLLLVAPSSSALGQENDSRPYTWSDGEHVRTVMLAPSLWVGGNGTTIESSDGEVAKVIGPVSKAATGPTAAAVPRHPVFRSATGELMTLPGGVLVIFDGSWSKQKVEALFARAEVTSDRVEPLVGFENGFYVSTEPGFPSLELANEWAGMKGVELSSPNWWTELTTK